MRSPWRVPRRSAGRRARPELARCRARSISERRRLLVCGAEWSACAFRRFASLFCCRRRIYFSCVVVGKARTRRRRENGAACASLRASAKQSSRLARESGCFVAIAPRNGELTIGERQGLASFSEQSGGLTAFATLLIARLGLGVRILRRAQRRRFGARHRRLRLVAALGVAPASQAFRDHL